MLQHFGDGSLDLGKTEKWFLGDLSFMYQLVHFRSHSTRIVWNYDLSQVSPGTLGIVRQVPAFQKEQTRNFPGKRELSKNLRISGTIPFSLDLWAFR